MLFWNLMLHNSILIFDFLLLKHKDLAKRLRNYITQEHTEKYK